MPADKYPSIFSCQNEMEAIVYIFPTSQNCSKDLKDNKDSSLDLGRKYVRIFVLGHYLFLVAHSFPRAKLLEQIMFADKYPSIFSLQMATIVYIYLVLHLQSSPSVTHDTQLILRALVLRLRLRKLPRVASSCRDKSVTGRFIHKSIHLHEGR